LCCVDLMQLDAQSHRYLGRPCLSACLLAALPVSLSSISMSAMVIMSTLMQPHVYTACHAARRKAIHPTIFMPLLLLPCQRWVDVLT
jgi:hypothetical protein